MSQGARKRPNSRLIKSGSANLQIHFWQHLRVLWEGDAGPWGECSAPISCTAKRQAGGSEGAPDFCGDCPIL